MITTTAIPLPRWANGGTGPTSNSTAVFAEREAEPQPRFSDSIVSPLSVNIKGSSCLQNKETQLCDFPYICVLRTLLC